MSRSCYDLSTTFPNIDSYPVVDLMETSWAGYTIYAPSFNCAPPFSASPCEKTPRTASCHSTELCFTAKHQQSIQAHATEESAKHFPGWPAFPFTAVQCMLVINQVTGFGSRRDRSEDPYAGNKGMCLLLVSMHIGPGRLSPNTCILHLRRQ